MGLVLETMQIFLIVIVAVLASLVVTVLALAVLRCTRRKKATPYPAVQPLAHVRKQHLQQSIPQVYTSADNLLSIPTSPSTNSHSASSLVSSDGSPVPSTRPSRSSSHVRPASTTSSSRGPRHSRHSPMQIVLPAPLGSNVDQTSVSLADQWGSPRPLSHSPQLPRAPRSRSQSRSRAHAQDYSQSSSPAGQSPPAPPVPRIPSIYNTPQDAERGRPARSQR